MSLKHYLIASLSSLLTSAGIAVAQTPLTEEPRLVSDLPAPLAAPLTPDSIAVEEYLPVPEDTVIVMAPLSPTLFIEPIFTHFQLFDDKDPFASELSGEPYMEWIERNNAIADRDARIWQRFMIANPMLVKKNIAFMAKPPQEFYAEVNPQEHTIELKPVEIITPEKIAIEVHKRHWIRAFNASLQFSQAYVSPNWYQGGNNNLNMLANIFYSVKLNPAYHENLLFENTFQYKLGLNSVTDDEYRKYAISEDLLQINSTFGLKAAKKWYYSINAQFKTQVLNSYVRNTMTLNSAFLSPGELTAGLGMTYNHTNSKKTFTFDASIAPLSYNLKICTRPNDEISHDTWNIAADRSTVSNIGSSGEAKLSWQITHNINFRSRLFVFTDYSQIQGDWENTLSMDINRYLATQIYVHARYDSSTPRCDDPSWHKLQVKEILSFGVTYKFSSI